MRKIILSIMLTVSMSGPSVAWESMFSRGLTRQVHADGPVKVVFFCDPEHLTQDADASLHLTIRDGVQPGSIAFAKADGTGVRFPAEYGLVKIHKSNAKEWASWQSFLSMVQAGSLSMVQVGKKTYPFHPKAFNIGC